MSWWGTSSRGRGRKLPLELDRGLRRLLLPSPSLKLRSARRSRSGCRLQGRSLERALRGGHLDGTRDGTPLRPLCKCLRFWQAGMELCSSWDTQGKPHKRVPLLLRPATYQSGVACLFLWSPLASRVRGPVCKPRVWEPCGVGVVSGPALEGTNHPAVCDLLRLAFSQPHAFKMHANCCWYQ